jgi:hypothetical protein
MDQWFAELDSVQVATTTHKIPRRDMEFTALIQYRSNVNLRLGVIVHALSVDEGGNNVTNVITGSYRAYSTDEMALDPDFCYSPAIHCGIDGVAQYCPLLCTDRPTSDDAVVGTTAEPVALTDAPFCALINCSSLGSAASACPNRCPGAAAPTPPPRLAGCCSGDDNEFCAETLPDPETQCFYPGGDLRNTQFFSECPRTCLQCTPCEQALELRQGTIYVSYTLSRATAADVVAGDRLRVEFFLLPRSG